MLVLLLTTSNSFAGVTPKVTDCSQKEHMTVMIEVEKKKALLRQKYDSWMKKKKNIKPPTGFSSQAELDRFNQESKNIDRELTLAHEQLMDTERSYAAYRKCLFRKREEQEAREK